MKRFFRAATLSLALLGTAIGSASAEGLIRISEQFGTLYIPFHILRDQNLIEKHAKELGIDVKVEWLKLSGGNAVNDALLSGSVDIASAGIGPFFTVWDRTKGAVKIVGAFGATPNYLLTNKQDIKSLKDFGPNDRIATPAAGVSVQARTLQIAAEKEFGPGNQGKLDSLQVTLPHPDATAALISGSTEITGHLSNSPFQEQALKDPKVHKVWSSYDVLGGPFTPTVAYTTLKWRDANPKTYEAFFRAFKEATEIAAKDHQLAADTYVKIEKSKLDPAFVKQIIDNPEVRFTLVPLKSEAFGAFLFRTGAIKTDPGSWKSYTFPELHDQAGS
ncbi:NitT/TauT family transport system substrate-binding protein [Ancylobacter sp. 3268]|uniref:ABC transporter substrate-binding protein n=1 Tax=Ancylobacter sp. 3268 TaxID=2817752 RepID=UPI0028646380|nr:ABC transporter substrate-binding protein [Ancylobacter sp. 3268]MDR6955035.1 NitT/TauT family transport system substrate-binding protein [Ancylobacter sp. 3268]